MKRGAPFLVSWAVTGLAMAGVVLAGNLWRAFGHRERLERSWQLTPAVVAARDLAEGTVLAPGDLAVQPLPASMLTASALPAGELDRATGQKLSAAVAKGDLLYRSFLRPRPLSRGCAASAAATAAELEVAGAPQVKQFLDELQRALDSQPAPGATGGD